MYFSEQASAMLLEAHTLSRLMLLQNAASATSALASGSTVTITVVSGTISAQASGHGLL